MFSYMTGTIISVKCLLAKDPTFLLLNYLTTCKNIWQQTSRDNICKVNAIKGRCGSKTAKPTRGGYCGMHPFHHSDRIQFARRYTSYKPQHNKRLGEAVSL